MEILTTVIFILKTHSLMMLRILYHSKNILQPQFTKKTEQQLQQLMVQMRVIIFILSSGIKYIKKTIYFLVLKFLKEISMAFI